MQLLICGSKFNTKDCCQMYRLNASEPAYLVKPVQLVHW